MKNRIIWLALAAAGLAMAAEPVPILNYDFTAPVIRQGGKYPPPALPPDMRFSSPDPALILTGEKSRLELPVPASSKLSLAEGGTFYALVRFEQNGVKAGQNDSHDMILFKNGDFLFGRSCSKLYFNFGEKWSCPVTADNIPTRCWTALAASVKKNAPGNYTVRLYIDGRKAAEKNFRRKIAAPNANPVTLGEGWGGPWYFQGELGKVMIFDQALSDQQIAALAAAETRLKKKPVRPITGENLFLDPGFESYRKKQQNPYWWQLTSESDGIALSDFKDKHSGQKALKVTVREGKDALTVRYFSAPFRTQPGTRWLFSVWAKGEGTLNLVLQQRVETVNAPPYRTRRIEELKSPDFQLGKEWKRYDFSAAGYDPQLASVEPQITLSGKNSRAWLDDAELKNATGDQDRILHAFPYCAVVKPGMTAVCDYPADRMPEGSVLIFGPVLQKLNGERKNLSADGKITFKVPEKTGCYPFAVINEEQGIGHRCYVHVLPAAQYDRLRTIAQKVRNPGTVLVLGDSLSDYLRGYNWVEIVSHFCRERFPGKADFFNYAIGGDQAPRVLDRLKEVRGTYALERYRGLRELKPDLILISLGQNDSLSLDRNLKDKSPTQVPPEKYKDCMAKIIAHLRKQYPGAKIVLFTPFALCFKKSWKNYFANRKLVFGEPGIMRKYAELVREIAAENHCEVLDVHTPFGALKDSAPYFLHDGIHLNITGNLYASEIVLEFLTRGE